jgi:hypothetical protein
MKTILISFLAVILVFGLSIDASAQKKRKKKAPLPMPTPVQTVEPAVISRASDETDTPINPDAVPANEVSTSNQGNQGSQIVTTSNPQVEALAQQVRDLTSKIDSMDAKQKLLLDMQILSNAEVRSENLHQKLLESADKEAAIKTRLDQIEYDIRPDVIERKAAFIGSLRPEEVRENMRKTLQDEKDRLTNQITQLQGNRASLETSTASADAMVEKLRTKLEAEIEAQMAAPVKRPE